MARLIVNRGLLRIGQQASQSTNFSATRQIQVMSVDDATGAFAAANTKLDDGAGFTQEFDKVFNATPTESGQAISHVTKFLTAEANFTWRRVALHDDTAANVTGASATLVGGIDGLTIVKTVNFAITITLKLTYSN